MKSRSAYDVTVTIITIHELQQVITAVILMYNKGAHC